MYKYDIPSPKKEQYTLLFGNDNKLLIPINVSKSVPYLKTKINAHRNMMGTEDIGIYSIVDFDGKLIYTRTFSKGEQSNNSAPYHKNTQKPTVIYKRVYLYDPEGDLTDIECENKYPITYYDSNHASHNSTAHSNVATRAAATPVPTQTPVPANLIKTPQTLPDTLPIK